MLGIPGRRVEAVPGGLERHGGSSLAVPAVDPVPVGGFRDFDQGVGARVELVRFEIAERALELVEPAGASRGGIEVDA